MRLAPLLPGDGHRDGQAHGRGAQPRAPPPHRHPGRHRADERRPLRLDGARRRRGHRRARPRGPRRRGQRVLPAGRSSRPSPTAWTCPREIRARVAAMLEAGGLPALVGELGRAQPRPASAGSTRPTRAGSRPRSAAASPRAGRLPSSRRTSPAPAPPFAGWEVRLARLERAGRRPRGAGSPRRVDAHAAGGPGGRGARGSWRRACARIRALPGRSATARRSTSSRGGRAHRRPGSGDREGHARPCEEAAHVVPHPAAGAPRCGRGRARGRRPAYSLGEGRLFW